MPDLHPPCASCGTRWFHGHTVDCSTRTVLGEVPEWFLEIKRKAAETAAETPIEASAPRRWSRIGVWCARGEHDRCRSSWGARPCRCRCHRIPVTRRNDVLVAATIVMNGQPHELRAIGVGGAVYSGVFSTPAEIADLAHELDGAVHCYLGLNPTTLKPHDIDRVGTGEGVSDAQIARVDWLGVDVDPVTDEDVFPVAAEVNDYLLELGFPEAGVFGSSGRGYWLLWRVEQVNTPETADLRRRFLLALKRRWPQVDAATYNASRVARLFGTVNLKNRTRSVLYRVTETMPVPIELLEQVAGPPSEHADQGVRGSVELIISKLAERGIEVSHERRLERGTAMQLSACPFHPDRNHRTAAALYAWDDGNVGFRCLGDACTAEDNRIFRLAELLGVELIATKVDGTSAWTSASRIAPTQMDTTWDRRIVLHGLNLNVGDEGAGKGLLAVRLAASLSTGLLLPGPITVAYASTEEVTAAVVVPRLIAAGADLDRVLVAPMGSLGLPDALPEVLEQLEGAGAAWLFLDPVNAHFSSGLDPNRTKDVNLVLNALAQAAAGHRLTIVGNLHTNRGGGVTPRDRYAHQAEFRRVTRSSVIIGQGPDDGPDERTVVHDKHSYTAPAPSLSARIEVVAGVATLVLGAEVDVTPEELFLRDADKDAALRRVRGEIGQTPQCVEEIEAIRSSLGGPLAVSSSEFSGIAKTYGASTIVRARQRLGITVHRLTDPETNRVTGWEWRFPA
jgi:AAA domain